MERALTGFARVLRPGGRLLVSAPTGGGPDWDFFGRLCEEFGLATMPVDVLPQPEIARSTSGSGWLTYRYRTRPCILTSRTSGRGGWAWSHGQRWYLAQLPADRVDEFQRRAFDHLHGIRTERGIPLDQNFMIAKSSRWPGP